MRNLGFSRRCLYRALFVTSLFPNKDLAVHGGLIRERNEAGIGKIVLHHTQIQPVHAVGGIVGGLFNIAQMLILQKSHVLAHLGR